MNAILTWVTLGVTGLVVIVLAFYLIDVALALTRAHRHLERIAGGLEAVAAHSAPLPARLGTINGALGRLVDGLRSVDSHLAGIARVFGR